jgi:hypothetical protein
MRKYVTSLDHIGMLIVFDLVCFFVGRMCSSAKLEPPPISAPDQSFLQWRFL